MFKTYIEKTIPSQRGYDYKIKINPQRIIGTALSCSYTQPLYVIQCHSMQLLLVLLVEKPRQYTSVNASLDLYNINKSRDELIYLQAILSD